MQSIAVGARERQPRRFLVERAVHLATHDGVGRDSVMHSVLNSVGDSLLPGQPAWASIAHEPPTRARIGEQP